MVPYSWRAPTSLSRTRKMTPKRKRLSEQCRMLLSREEILPCEDNSSLRVMGD